MDIQNVLNQLTANTDEKLPQELQIDLLGEPGRDAANRDQLFAELVKNDAALKNDALYDAVRNYLHMRLFDHAQLKENEAALVPKFSELDVEQIIRVDVDNALIQRAANGEAITDEEAHALYLTLQDRAIDGFELTADEELAFAAIAIAPEVALENVDAKVQNKVEIAQFEYGYNIYDLAEVKKHLITADRENLPISHREAAIIEREHGFNPHDRIGF